MHRMSTAQALSVWSDLCDAYHGKNGFGGDTAEVYLFRVGPRCPLAEAQDRGEVGSVLRAQDERSRSETQSLYALLRHFEEVRGVLLHVDGRRLGPWMLDLALDHRVHVRVERLP